MNSLISRAKELLENNSVQLIIGYENGTSGKVRASFITNPYKADKLIYDERCKQNLAVYLIKKEVKKIGRMGIVANLSVMRTILMLMSENQLKESDILILGMNDLNELMEFTDICKVEEYVEKCNLGNPDPDKEMLKKLNSMSIQERWEYWQNEFSKCIRCYACRAACPLCYCKKCTVECNQPQWIPVPAHAAGNLDWHIMRSMHLAGRCVSCGECGRACPVDIPIHLMTMQMAEEVHEMFGIWAGTSKEMPSVLSTFKPDDKENFII